MAGINRLTLSIIKAVNRPDIGPQIDSVLTNVNSAINIVKKQSSIMLLSPEMKELEIIIVWKDAIDEVRKNVFEGDLRDGKEEDQILFDEIKGIIEDGDVAEIYKAFNGLKDAAQKYISAIKQS